MIMGHFSIFIRIFNMYNSVIFIVFNFEIPMVVIVELGILCNSKL